MFSGTLSFWKNLSLLMFFAVSAKTQTSLWKKEFQNNVSNLTIVDENVAVMQYNYLFGLINIRKDTLIPPVYDRITLVPQLSRAIVSRHSKMGVADYNGRLIIPMAYRSVREDGGHFFVEHDSKMFLYDAEGSLIYTWNAGDIESVDVTNKLLITKDTYQLWGIQSFDGKTILPPLYESIKKIYDEKYLLQKNNEYILWHITGKKEKIWNSEDEVLFANLIGFVSKKRNHSGKVQYEDGRSYPFDHIKMNYQDKFVIGENESQSVLFDDKLSIVDTCSFCTMQPLEKPYNKYISDGHLMDSNYYLISKQDKTKKLLGKNNLRIEGDYHYFQLYGQYILGVKTYAIDFFDHTGQLLESVKGSRFSTHEDEIIIDVNDSLSLRINRDFQKKFVEGRGRLKQVQKYFYLYDYKYNQKCNLLDEGGKQVLSCDQINSYPFIQNNGDAILTYEINGKKGWIASDRITQPSYSDIVFFPDGTALVKKKGKFGRINSKEEILLDFLYDQYNVLNQSMIFALKKGEKWHIYRNTEWLDSTETLEFEYDFFKYKKGDLWKTISKNGKIFPLNLESTYKDYITCENKQCRMYLRDKDYTEFLTFDTIFQSGYEYVGKIKDSLYYFNYNSKVETVVKGNKPEGRVSDYRIYDDGDSLVIINRKGYNPYRRRFHNIQALYYGNFTFYTKEDGKYTFFNKGAPKYSIEADTLYSIYENIYALKNRGKYEWLDIDTKKKITPVARSVSSKTKKNYTAKDSLYFDLLLDKDFKILAGPFDQIRSWGNEKYFEVSHGNKKAMLDTDGNVLIPFDTYDSSFKALSELLISASKNGMVGVYHTVEKKWYPADKYQDIKSCNIRLPLNGELFLFRQNGKYGVMDEKCDVLIPGDYVSIRPQGNYLVLEKEHYKSIFYYLPKLKQVDVEFINYRFLGQTTDNIVIKTQNEYIKYKGDSITARTSYDYVEPIYGEKRFFFRGDNGMMGVLDENFHVVIQPKYDYLHSRYDGTYQAHLDSYQGFIDKEEKVVLPVIYDEIEVEGIHYRCKKDKKYFIFNKNEKLLIPIAYDSVFQQGEYLICVFQNKFIVKNIFLEDIYELEGDQIMVLNDQYVGIKKDNFWRLYNRNTQKMATDRFKFFGNSMSVDKLTVIRENEKQYRLFDVNTQKYDADPNLNGIYIDVNAEGWKLLKAQGIVSVAEYALQILTIQDTKTGLVGLANVIGDVFVKPEYEKISYLYSSSVYGTYVKNKKHGIIQKDLTFLPNLYDSLEFISDYKFRATIGDKTFILNEKGEVEK